MHLEEERPKDEGRPLKVVLRVGYFQWPDLEPPLPLLPFSKPVNEFI